jgi:hypothetical protein
MQQISTPFAFPAAAAPTVSARPDTLAMLRLFARVYQPLRRGLDLSGAMRLEHGRFEGQPITGEAI